MREDALDWVKEQEIGCDAASTLFWWLRSRCRRGVDSFSDASITLVLIVWVVIVRPRRKAVELGVNDAGERHPSRLGRLQPKQASLRANQRGSTFGCSPGGGITSSLVPALGSGACVKMSSSPVLGGVITPLC